MIAQFIRGLPMAFIAIGNAKNTTENSSLLIISYFFPQFICKYEKYSIVLRTIKRITKD